MMGQRWLFAGIAATVLATSGCMTCCHDGYHLAREAAPDCELPSSQRDHVYIFAISSFNPISVVALDGLREQLNRQGFAKVATGQTIHSGWMAREMRRIRAQEPEAVFIVVGFESAGSTAVSLADRVAARGIPVGGVVVIHTDGEVSQSTQGLRVLAIGKPDQAASASAELTPAGNVATYGLAADARTVEAVGNLARDVAGVVSIPEIVEQAEWSYPYAPPMREAGDPARDPEWSFLFDQYAGAARPQLPAPAPAAPPVIAMPVENSGAALKSAIR